MLPNSYLQIIALYFGDDDAFIRFSKVKNILHRLGTSEIHAVYRIEGYHLSIIQARDCNVAIRRYHYSSCFHKINVIGILAALGIKPIEG